MPLPSNAIAFAMCVAIAVATGALLSTPPVPESRGVLLGVQALAARGGLAGSSSSAAAAAPAPRVAVAYNANLDLVGRAVEALDSTRIEPVAASEVHDVAVVSSAADLAAVFQQYQAQGAAAERSVADLPLYRLLVGMTRSLSDSFHAIGGNAAIMGTTFAELGCPVLLGGKVGSRLQSLMSSNVTVVSSQLVEDDEVHVILEYAEGEKWGGVAAPRANRFIVSNDQVNSNLLSLEAFHAALGEFKPDIVVIAGLHLLEALGEPQRTQRLNAAVAAIKASRAELPQAVFHLELASMADAAFIAQIADAVIPLVHSLGMNEQEISALYKALGLGADSDVANVAVNNPEPQAAAKAVHAVITRYNTLGRLHLHALPFQLVAITKSSTSMFKSGAVSAAAAAVTATTRACGVDVETIRSTQIGLRLHEPFNITASPKDSTLESLQFHFTPATPTATWAWPLETPADSPNVIVEYDMAPVVVCRKPSRTVGLGDKISATGLAYQARS